ncbi:MAG: hypothetical protein FWC95_05325 [Defluviitaleaceae bacterium]|nr:hypothetical protein [Defluviitaleaceae bacterium]
MIDPKMLLEKIFANERFSHAYLFSGNITECAALAGLAARMLLCEGEEIANKPCGICYSCNVISNDNHPDLTVIRPDKKTTISMELIRDELTNITHILPYRGQRKVFIVENADFIISKNQNVLLKTLEEPPPHVIILLCAENEDLLLPTVRSRLSIIKIPQAQAAMYDGASELYKTLPALLGNLHRLNHGEILLEAGKYEDYKDEAGLFLDACLVWYRDVAAYNAGHALAHEAWLAMVKDAPQFNPRAAEYIEEARASLRYNAGFRLVLDVLLLKLKGI